MTVIKNGLLDDRVNLRNVGEIGIPSGETGYLMYEFTARRA